MKKLFLLVITLSLLCFSSVALAASSGQILTKEEGAASRTMSALTGITSYETVSQDFTPELRQALDKAKLAEMKKEVRTKFGKMKDMRLVMLQKFDQGDRVTYLASFAKHDLVKVEFLFNVSEDAPKIASFALTPIETAKEPQAEQK